MKFRLISDLHIDVNYMNPLVCKESEDKEPIFTLIAGDISGDPALDIKWLNKKTNYHGAFIAGNHIVYNYNKKTVQELQDELREAFPIDGEQPMKYLEKDTIVFEKEKIVLYGATLWTNYEDKARSVEENQFIAWNKLNDFKFGYVGKGLRMTPEWVRDECLKTLKDIDNVCKKYKDYKIIVMTHHCPSKKSISLRFINSDANSSYANSLEKFILAHPNIKVWCCGHVHTRHQYNIGDCRVYANPRGYHVYDEDYDWSEDGCIFEL